MSYMSAILRSGSAMTGKFRAAPCVSSMSLAQPLCESMGSTLRPMIFTLRRSNSGLMRAHSPSSVVQTGVKSLGCENRTPQLSPSHSWKLIVPSVVSAVKSGAVSPNLIAITNILSSSKGLIPYEVKRGILQDCFSVFHRLLYKLADKSIPNDSQESGVVSLESKTKDCL